MSKKKTGPLLELIVTHYDEPWEVGKKFFDMLALQRDVNFRDFGVIVVQDGKEGCLDWQGLMPKMPYAVGLKIIPHGGTAAARNAGIASATADWVMFCDFDDMFTNVCSLKLIINVLRDEETDVGWMETWREEKRGENFVNILKENMQSTDGKVYRLEMLNENNIRFRKEFIHLYESAFNDKVFTAVPAHRIKQISMPFAAYMKTRRDDGFNSREENLPRIMDEMVMENIMNAYDAIDAKDIANARVFVGDALFDGYFALNCKPDVVSFGVRDAFMNFVGDAREIIAGLDISTLELSMTYAMARSDMLVQRMFMTFGLEMMPPVENLSFALKWIGKLNPGLKLKDTPKAPAPGLQKKNEERVVVYCGTRNTYDCMVSSAKTLLANTRVDRIYFLTEDDTFPQPLPEIVTNINVSKQSFFRDDGPNFTNAWTYMCLMRAAFTKLLPQHNKVLSLDIDVAITGDISALWDYDMDDYYLAGVREPSRPADDYINFGIVMMNLGKIRMDHIDDRVISLLNEKYYDCPEQTCFSEACAGHILTLPPEYNHVPHSTITGDCDDPIIIHYAGIKYWKHYAHFRQYEGMTLEDIAKEMPHE